MNFSPVYCPSPLCLPKQRVSKQEHLKEIGSSEPLSFNFVQSQIQSNECWASPQLLNWNGEREIPAQNSNKMAGQSIICSKLERKPHIMSCSDGNGSVSNYKVSWGSSILWESVGRYPFSRLNWKILHLRGCFCSTGGCFPLPVAVAEQVSLLPDAF